MIMGDVEGVTIGKGANPDLRPQPIVRARHWLMLRSS